MMWWLILLSLTAHGEVLELKNVVRQGMDFSPELKRAEATMRAAQSSSKVTERRLFPTIDAVMTSTFEKDPDHFSLFDSSSSSEADENYDAYLKLEQPLYKGGALVNGIGSFKANEEIQRQNWINSRQEVVESLVRAYYNLAEGEKKLEAAIEQREVLRAYADIVNRYERIGRSRRMDRLQAAVNLSLAEAEYVNFVRLRAAASDALKRLLGLPEGGTPLDGELKIVVAPAAPMKLAKAFEATEANNPELRAAQLQVKKRGYDNGLDLVEDKPKLTLEGRWGFQAPDRPEWFDEASRYYSIGLNLTIPLFSGFSSVAKRRVHNELERQDEKSLEIKRLDLRQRLQAAMITLDSEFARLTAAQRAAEQGREALRLATNAYRQGTASPPDVVEAQRTRYNAERLLIESQFSYLRALLEVRRLMGVDLEKVYGQ